MDVSAECHGRVVHDDPRRENGTIRDVSDREASLAWIATDVGVVGRMPKPKRLWKVNELIRHSGLTRQTIHNYTLLGLIEPAEWTEGGHRLFDGTVFERLRRIERLKQRGKRLQEIAELLNRPRTSKRHDERTSGQDGTRGEAHAQQDEQPDDAGH